MKRSFDFGNKTGLQKKSQFNDVIFVEKSMETNQGSKNIAYVKSQFIYIMCTGKFMSEALMFASPNPQYDNTLFIELRVQYMKIPSSEHVVYINCSECQNKNKKKPFVYTICSELGIFMY